MAEEEILQSLSLEIQSTRKENEDPCESDEVEIDMNSDETEEDIENKLVFHAILLA